MNTPMLALGFETDALRDDPRPCEPSPRPIPLPETGLHSRCGGGR
jgi:hypothetical protein